MAATKFNGVVFIERRYELVIHREHFNLFSKCAATIECASLVNDFSWKFSPHAWSGNEIVSLVFDFLLAVPRFQNFAGVILTGVFIQQKIGAAMQYRKLWEIQQWKVRAVSSERNFNIGRRYSILSGSIRRLFRWLFRLTSCKDRKFIFLQFILALDFWVILYWRRNPVDRRRCCWSTTWALRRRWSTTWALRRRSAADAGSFRRPSSLAGCMQCLRAALISNKNTNQ